MTEKFKDFLKAVSQSEQLSNELESLDTPEKVLAFARAHGYDLTKEDLGAGAKASGEIDDDELEAVAGGAICGCAVGGGGKGDSSSGDRKCWCAGVGFGKDKYGNYRCSCPVAGGGQHCESGGSLP